MLCSALILPGFPCPPRWTPLEEWTQSLSNQCAVYWQFGRRGGEMPIHIRIWKPHWLAVLQNPSCALGPGMTFPPPSPLPSPLPRSTTPLQAPALLLQSLPSRIHTSPFKFPSPDSIQEDLTLSYLLPLNLLTKPIPSRYSEKKRILQLPGTTLMMFVWI